MKTRIDRRERAFYSFNIFALFRALGKSDVFMCGGGNLLQDVTSSRSLWFYLFVIRLAKLRGCRILMYGCGVGPVIKPFNRRLTAKTLSRHVEAITLREAASLAELELMGVNGPNISLSADPALTLQPQDGDKIDSVLLKQKIPLDGQYIGFALRDWAGFDLSAAVKAARYAYETYGLTPIFIPMMRNGKRWMDQDLRVAEEAAAAVNCPCYVLRETGSARVTIGLLSRMQVVVAMRLHALIFAAGQGIPLVAIPYNDKVSAFMEYMGVDTCISLVNLTASALCELIDKAAVSRGERDLRLRAVTDLLERERVNSDVLEGFLPKDK